MKKRIIPVIMALMMVFTIAPTTAPELTVFADNACNCFNGVWLEEIFIPATPQSDGQRYYACVKCGIHDGDIEVISRVETITLQKTKYTYDGEYKKPKIRIVTIDGKVLECGTDYEVNYFNNQNIGTATATITFKGNYSGTVNKSFYITKGKLTLNCKKLNLKLTGKKQLKLIKSPGNSFSSKVKWKSSNPKVAKVSSRGLVTPTGFGKCTITAYIKGGAQSKCQVSIKECDLYLFKNHTFKLAKINGKKHNWTSKNKSIATAGKIATGISQGKTTLYKKVKGVTYKYNIYVTDYQKLANDAIKKNPGWDLHSIGYYVSYNEQTGNSQPVELQPPIVCLYYTSWSLLFGYDYDYEYFRYNKNFKVKSICYEDELNECDHSIGCYQYNNFGNRRSKQHY